MKKKQLKGWALFWAVLFLVLLSLVTVHAEGTETEDEIQLMPEESVQQQLDSSALAQSSGGESAVFGIAVMNKQKSVELSWDGNYTTVVAAGFYKNQKPSLVAAAPSSTGDMQVIEAWRVQNLKNNTLLSMTARLNSLPTLGEGESLAFYALNSGSLSADPLLEDLSAGDLATIQLYFKGYDGIALVRMAADPADLPVENNFIWANEDIYLTGKMPGNAVVDATPVTVEVDGEFVLAAYDVKIYTNAKQREKGKTWQPSDEKVQVHFFNEEFKDGQALNIYHMADTASQPELVDTVTSEDNWITFEAESFSVYAITVIEKTVEASNGDTYKITVAFDTDSGIPADAQVEAEEISTDSAQYRNYLLSAADALGVDVSSVVFSRLFDISLVGPDGTQYQPNDTVSVTIQLLEKEAQDVERVRVVHFADESAASQPLRLNVMNLNSTASVQDTQSIAANGSELSATTNGSTVTFDTDGFSMFALVDFTTKENMVSATFDGETVQKLYEDDNIIISGSMPPYGIVEARPVQVQFPGQNVLIAYDIKIYANSEMKDAGINWQPSAGALKVQLNSNILEDGKVFNIYHMEDENSEPEFITQASALDHAVTFNAERFSVYPVSDENTKPRIFYSFISGEEVLTTEYITEINEFYDPGVSPKYGQTFKGWAYNAAETNEANMLTFEQLKTNLETQLAVPFADGTEVKVYAKFKEAYYLRYMVMKDNGEVQVVQTDSVLADAADKDVTIYCSYVATDQEGWIDAMSGQKYQNNATVTLDHHIDLYAKIPGRNWLVFNANTTGATFTGPQLIYDERVTVKPDDPTKKGYIFQGWNDKADGTGNWWYKADGSVDTFGGTITDDITLYAQWEGAPNSYTIVYMKQVASDDVGLANDAKNYNYVESVTISDGVKTGDTIDALPSGYNTKGTTTNTESNYYQTQYSWTDFESGMTVSADGDTVIHVYYDRIAYHLYFQIPVYQKTTGTSGDQFGYYYNSYVPIYYNNGNWYRTRTVNWGRYSYSDRYTGDRYIIQEWTTIKDINALYEHNIADEFPIVGTNGVTYNHGERWEPQSNNQGWNQVMVVVDSMPNEDIYFHLNTSNYTTKHMTYYVEALPEQTPTFTYDGIGYVQYGQTVEANYNFVTEEDRLDIAGFTPRTVIGGANASATETLKLTTGQNPHYYYGNNTNNTAVYVNFLYARKVHEIDFNSWGANVTENTTQTVTNVPYEAKIVDYLPTDPTNGNEGYFFAGWYKNEECTEPLEETDRMPDDNAAFFAKWDTFRVRVVLDPNCLDFWFDNNQAVKFRVNYGEPVSLANVAPNVAKRPGYKLVGWYYTPDFQSGTEVDTANPLPITLTTPGLDMGYQDSIDWTDNIYGDNDGAHTNVRAILKLYARWQLNLDENAVYFLYEVDDGYCIFDASGNNQTEIPVDAVGHTLGTDFQIAEAPKGYANGIKFYKWMVLNNNGGATSVVYNPGDTVDNFTVDMWEPYIQTMTVTDDFGNVGTMKVVRLRALFNAEKDQATTIVFHGNGGTMNGTENYTQVLPLNATIDLQVQSAAFTKEHYSIVGWATQADGTGTVFSTTEQLYANNDSLAEDGMNHLYAIWQPDIEIVATGPKEEVIYDGEEHETKGAYTFSYMLGGVEKTEAELNAMGITVTINQNDWPQAKGTEKGVYTADALTDTELESLIQIDSTAYTGGLNIKRVYIPAELTIRDLLLTITKTVTGGFSNERDSFTFTLVSAEGVGNGTGNFPITYTRALEGTTVSGKINVGGTFWMRHGDTVTIEGLPKDKSVVFSEASGFYNASWKLGDAAETYGDQTTLSLPGDITLAVVNDYPPPAPTSVDLRVAPYALMLLMGLALMMGLRYGKKRQMN